jgi:hypothetical protein
MKNRALLLQKISSLNPPKKNASAETWDRFYQSKGLSEIHPDSMVDLIDELLEQ